MEVKPDALIWLWVMMDTGCAVSTSVRLMRVPVTSILPSWAVLVSVAAVVVAASAANADGATTIGSKAEAYSAR